MIGERPRNSDPLLFSPAQLVREMISPVLEPYSAQKLYRPVFRLFSFHSRSYEWKLNILQRC